MTRLFAVVLVTAVTSVALTAACKRPADPPGAPPAATSEAAPPESTTPAPNAKSVLPPSAPPQRKLGAPANFPPLARRILQEQMQRHADYAESLLWSALMLDHDSARQIASWVSDDLAIARPIEGQKDALNTLLPEAYFAFQDALHDAANELAAAAKEKDDQAVAVAYGQLTRTCIGCHSLYMKLPPPKGRPAAR